MGDQTEVEQTKLESGANVAYFRASNSGAGIGPWEADEQQSPVDAVNLHRKQSAHSASSSHQAATTSATSSSRHIPQPTRSYSYWKAPAPPPKPKPPAPRQKHTTEGIDPIFLETESYTNRCGVGMVRGKEGPG